MKTHKFFILSVTIALFLSACGTATQIPTNTPIPPTYTPEPTSTLAPSPTPTLAPGDISVREKDGMNMVYVPAGEFTMGAPAAVLTASCLNYMVSCGYSDSNTDAPVHSVTLDAFWIDQTEVTFAQYALCRKDGACTATASQGSICGNFKFCESPVDPNNLSAYIQPFYPAKLMGQPVQIYLKKEYANYPVVIVSWEDAQKYCAWAGGRLPTEAEWEKAARGTDGRLFPWGTAKFTGEYANAANNINHSTAVGSFPKGASPYGALDMAGNVEEWVADYYSEDYYRESFTSNPTGPADGSFRVVRGGSWIDYPDGLFATSRGWNIPTIYDIIFGFRCAQDVNP